MSSSDKINNENGDNNDEQKNTTTTTTTTQQRMLTDSVLESENETATLCTLQTSTFNQDGGCLAIGTNLGFMVYNLFPQFSVSVKRNMFHDGIQLIEMLFRCNLMAFVKGNGQSSVHNRFNPTTDSNHSSGRAGGPSSSSSSSSSACLNPPPSMTSNNNAHPSQSHRVFIWDDHLCKEIGELSFRQTVLAVKLRKDSIAVALRDRIYVYNLADLTLRDKIYTSDNPYGLLCVSTQISDMILACPSITVGHVRVELYHIRKTVLIEAHNSALRQIALTSDGYKLATCSHKGTIIRVWDVTSGQCLYEFRRGIERAVISCLCWNSWADNTMLACTSDHGTVHIFQMTGPDNSNNPNNNNGNNSYSNNPYHHGQYGNRNHHHHQHNNGGGSSSGSKKSLTSRLWRSLVSTNPDIPQEKSICQIRGIPHPQSCAFVSEATNVLAVAGYDQDGNGVLMLSDFSNVIGKGPSSIHDYNHHHHHHSHNNRNYGNIVVDPNTAANSAEPTRIGYYVLCRSYLEHQETEEQRRRRRLRGTIKKDSKEADNNTKDGDDNNANVKIDDRIEQQINFEDGDDDDDFVTVITTGITNAALSTSTAVSTTSNQNLPSNKDNITIDAADQDHDEKKAEDAAAMGPQSPKKVDSGEFPNEHNPAVSGEQSVSSSLLPSSPSNAQGAVEGTGSLSSNGCAYSGTIGDSIRTESLGGTQEISVVLDDADDEAEVI